jgi:hypothetical protein
MTQIIVLEVTAAKFPDARVSAMDRTVVTMAAADDACAQKVRNATAGRFAQKSRFAPRAVKKPNGNVALYADPHAANAQHLSSAKWENASTTADCLGCRY